MLGPTTGSRHGVLAPRHVHHHVTLARHHWVRPDPTKPRMRPARSAPVAHAYTWHSRSRGATTKLTWHRHSAARVCVYVRGKHTAARHASAILSNMHMLLLTPSRGGPGRQDFVCPRGCRSRLGIHYKQTSAPAAASGRAGPLRCALKALLVHVRGWPGSCSASSSLPLPLSGTLICNQIFQSQLDRQQPARPAVRACSGDLDATRQQGSRFGRIKMPPHPPQRGWAYYACKVVGTLPAQIPAWWL